MAPPGDVRYAVGWMVVLSTTLVLVSANGVERLGRPLDAGEGRVLTQSNITFLLEDLSLTDGVLFAISAFFLSQDAMRVQVWRPQSIVDRKYRMLWDARVSAPAPGIFTIYFRDMPGVECPFVQQGDRVGLYGETGAMPIAYTFMSQGSPSTLRHPLGVNQPRVNRGETVRFDALRYPYRYSVNAFVHTNLNAYTYSGQEAVTCPNISTQGAIPEKDQNEVQLPTRALRNNQKMKSKQRRTKKDLYTKCLYHRGSRLWDRLEPTQQKALSLKAFKNSLKEKDLSKLAPVQVVPATVFPPGEKDTNYGGVGHTGQPGPSGPSGPRGPPGFVYPVPGQTLGASSDAASCSCTSDGSLLHNHIILAIFVWLTALSVLNVCYLCAVCCRSVRKAASPKPPPPAQNNDQNMWVEKIRETVREFNGNAAAGNMTTGLGAVGAEGKLSKLDYDVPEDY